MAQWYCQVGGQQYGPIEELELRRWIQQNRLGGTDLVWREGMPEWVPASASGLMPFAAAAAYLRPHRGGAVLALGIIGLVACFICGIVAWVMGSKDLREMSAGRMDPSGKGITEAGRICGIVGTILGIINSIIVVIWITTRVLASLSGR